jgi:hypothetical protein
MAATLESERQEFAIKLAERQTETVPNEDPDYEDIGPAYRCGKRQSVTPFCSRRSP